MIMHQAIAEIDLSPEEHLGRELDLFQSIERGTAAECCRLWEAARPVVIVGRSTRPTDYVDHINLDACRADGVDILRRSSGGGVVVLGPGCLNYAIVLSLVSRPELVDVAASFGVILGQIAAALAVCDLAMAGPADLAWRGRKVSGNAQRRGRRALLHHGTLLYDFDARLAARYLKEPVRRPAYRAARGHAEFLDNLPLTAQETRSRLVHSFIPATNDSPCHPAQRSQPPKPGPSSRAVQAQVDRLKV